MIRAGKIERLRVYGSSAREAAIDRGHDPSPLRADTDTSMVSVCHKCGAVLGVDAEAPPFVFGAMAEKDCSPVFEGSVDLRTGAVTGKWR